MTGIFFATAAEATNALAICDRELGLPRRGIHYSTVRTLDDGRSAFTVDGRAPLDALRAAGVAFTGPSEMGPEWWTEPVRGG